MGVGPSLMRRANATPRRAVLLPDSTIGQAVQTGNRLRQAVEALGIPHGAREDGAAIVTISCGVAAAAPGAQTDAARLIAAADQAL
jgi:two-component system, chemotaxis family, response regulator WspR